MRGTCTIVRWRRLLPPLALAIGHVFAATPAVEAQAVAAEVVTVPTALEIPATVASVPLVVIVRNTTNGPIRGVKLSFLADAPVKVELPYTAAASLPVGGEAAWTAKVTTVEPLLAGAVHARVDYTSGPDDAPVAHVRTTTVKVSNRALSSTDDMVAVRVESSLQTLQQHRPGRVHLVLTNKSDAKLEISSLSVSNPEFITLTPPKTSPSLDPRQTTTIVYTVEANDRVVPGKHLLVFHIGLRWPGGGGHQTRTVVATREVDVGVFGESQVLQALAVPSFLLLPGCLALITARLLWDQVRLLRPTGDTTAFKLQFPNADFWVVSITISGVMAYVYPLFGQPSYLDGYGPADVARVWMISVFGVGLGGYLAVMLAWRGYRAARDPSRGDLPLAALRKLAWQKRPLVMDLCTVTIDGKAVEAFPFERDYPTRASCWALPAIEVTFADDATDEQRERVTSALTNLAMLRDVRQAVKAAVSAGAATVKWRKQDSFDEPTEIKADALGAFKRVERIVQVVSKP